MPARKKPHSPLFTRRAEDFTCAQCGLEVHGAGYTNHCPRCLWSKHVDVNPGDRSAACGGMMEPVRVRVGPRGRGYIITHRCVSCGFERENKSARDDDFDAILTITRRASAE